MVLVGHNANVADWCALSPPDSLSAPLSRALTDWCSVCVCKPYYIYHVCTKHGVDFAKMAAKHGIVGTADTLRLLRGVGKSDVTLGGLFARPGLRPSRRRTPCTRREGVDASRRRAPTTA